MLAMDIKILQNYLKILIVMVDLTSIYVVIVFSDLRLDKNEIVELLKY